MLGRRKWTAILVGAMVFLPWASHSIRRAQLYTGSAVVVIAADSQELSDPSGQTLKSTYHSFSLKLQSILSGQVVDRALDLAQGYQPFDSPIFRTPAMRSELAEATAHGTDRASLRRVLRLAVLDHDGRSQMVRIEVSTRDPDDARVLAWSLAEAAHQFHDDRIRAVYRERAAELEHQVGFLESGVAVTRARAADAEGVWLRREVESGSANLRRLLADEEGVLRTRLAIDEFRSMTKDQERNQARAQLDDRRSEARSAQDELNDVRRNVRATKMLIDSAPGPVAVAELAPEAIAALSPRRLSSNLLGALAVAMLCGLSLAFLHERIDSRVAGEAVLAEVLRAPLLGALRLDAGVTSEAASTLAATLTLRSNASLIAVVSPARGDGREFVADSLATALARSGKTVVTVVADPLCRPALDGIPGGESVTRAMATGGVDQLDRLAQEYDQVIFDQALVADSPVAPGLLARADQILGVARDGHTSEASLQALAAWVSSAGVSVTGTVWVFH